MKSRIRTHKKSRREQTSDFSTAPAQPMFQSRPFEVPGRKAKKEEGKEKGKADQKVEQKGQLEEGKVSIAPQAPSHGQRVVQRMELYNKGDGGRYRLDKLGKLEKIPAAEKDEKDELLKTIAREVEEKVLKKEKETGLYVGVTVTKGVMIIACNTKWNENPENPRRELNSEKVQEGELKEAGEEVLGEYQKRKEKLDPEHSQKWTPKQRAIYWVGKVEKENLKVKPPNEGAKHKNHGEERIREEVEANSGEHLDQLDQKRQEKIKERLKGEDQKKALEMRKVLRIGGTMPPCPDCDYMLTEGKGAQNANQKGVRYKMEKAHDNPDSSWRSYHGVTTQRGKDQAARGRQKKTEPTLGEKSGMLGWLKKPSGEASGSQGAGLPDRTVSGKKESAGEITDQQAGTAKEEAGARKGEKHERTKSMPDWKGIEPPTKKQASQRGEEAQEGGEEAPLEWELTDSEDLERREREKGLRR